MNVFNRFVLWLVLLGIALALGIVLVANWHSATRQAADLARERIMIKSLLASEPQWSTQAQFAVKAKQVDGEGQTSSTTIVWRWLPYYNQALPVFADATASSSASSPASQSAPPAARPPVQQFSFPGDRLAADALVLNFQRYAGTEGTASLVGITIAYVARIYPPDAPVADRINLTPDSGAPMIFRHDPNHVSQAEAYLWRDIGDRVRTPALAQRDGLDVRWTEPATMTVQPGYLYEVNVQKDPTALAGYTVKIVPHDDKAAERRELLFPETPTAGPRP